MSHRHGLKFTYLLTALAMLLGVVVATPNQATVNAQTPVRGWEGSYATYGHKNYIYGDYFEMSLWLGLGSDTLAYCMSAEQGNPDPYTSVHQAYFVPNNFDITTWPDWMRREQREWSHTQDVSLEVQYQRAMKIMLAGYGHNFFGWADRLLATPMPARERNQAYYLATQYAIWATTNRNGDKYRGVLADALWKHRSEIGGQAGIDATLQLFDAMVQNVDKVPLPENPRATFYSATTNKWNGRGYQELIPTNSTDGDKPTPVSVQISKADFGGMLVPGARLAVLNTDLMRARIDEWVSDSSAHAVSLWAPATYELRELQAPAGYVQTKPVRFRVDRDGSVTVLSNADFATATGSELQLKNEQDLVLNTTITTGDNSNESAERIVLSPGTQDAVTKTVTDKFHFEKFKGETTYDVLGLLRDVTAGRFVAKGSAVITATGSAEAHAGDDSIVFNDGQELQLTAGHTYVAYEYAYPRTIAEQPAFQLDQIELAQISEVNRPVAGQTPAAVHVNDNDAAQTIVVLPKLATQVKVNGVAKAADSELPVLAPTPTPGTANEVVDTVQLAGLLQDKPYTVLGLLKDITANRFIASGVKTLTGTGGSQEVQVSLLDQDGQNPRFYPTHRYVVYEYLYQQQSLPRPTAFGEFGFEVPAGVVIQHPSGDDEDPQQMIVTEGELATKVIQTGQAAAFGTLNLQADSSGTVKKPDLTDQVFYRGMANPEGYTLVAGVWDTITNKYVALATGEIPAHSSDGTAEVKIAPDVLLGDHTYVIHEFAYPKGSSKIPTSLGQLNINFTGEGAAATHVDNDDADQKIYVRPQLGTTVKVGENSAAATAPVQVQPGSGLTVTDTYEANGLRDQWRYQVVGFLKDLTTGRIVATAYDVDGNPDNKDGFIAKGTSRKGQVEFKNVTVESGHAYVAYEVLYAGEQTPYDKIASGLSAESLAKIQEWVAGNRTSRPWPEGYSAIHASDTDVAQMIVTGGTLRTTVAAAGASHPAEQMQLVKAITGSTVPVTDTVQLSQMNHGTYDLIGVLYDVSNLAQPVPLAVADKLGVTITGDTTVTAEVDFGEIQVTQGHRYVVYEYAYQRENPATPALTKQQVTIADGKVVWPSRVAGTRTTSHEVPTDQNQTFVVSPELHTTLTAAGITASATAPAWIPAGPGGVTAAAVTDQVAVSGTVAGEKYLVHGFLWDTTAKQYVAAGQAAFTASATNQTVNISFTRDNASPVLQAGHTYVAHEYLYPEGTDVNSFSLPDSSKYTAKGFSAQTGYLAKHEEPVPNQSAMVGGQLATTVAAGTSTASRYAAARTEQGTPAIVDTVRYEAMPAGTFSLLARLVDVTANPNQVVAQTTQPVTVAAGGAGSWQVSFDSKPALTAGHRYVVYEYLYPEGIIIPATDAPVPTAGLIAKHENPDDLAQTIVVNPKLQTTIAAGTARATSSNPAVPVTTNSSAVQLAVVDTVALAGLQPNVSYQLVGILVNKNTNQVVAAGTTTGIKAPTTSADVRLLVDGKDPLLAAGSQYVAVEYLYETPVTAPQVSAPIDLSRVAIPAGAVAWHHDLSDVAQTISMPGTMMTTIGARDVTGGNFVAVSSDAAKQIDQVATPQPTATVVDNVQLTNLPPAPNGQAYFLVGVLRDVTSQTNIAVAQSAGFTEQTTEQQIDFGKQTLTAGHTYVAYEYLYLATATPVPNLIAAAGTAAPGWIVKHENDQDSNQTLIVHPAIQTTASAGSGAAAVSGSANGPGVLVITSEQGVATPVQDKVELTGIPEDPNAEYDLVGVLQERSATDHTGTTIVAAGIMPNIQPQAGTQTVQVELKHAGQDPVLQSGKLYQLHEFLIKRPVGTPETELPVTPTTFNQVINTLGAGIFTQHLGVDDPRQQLLTTGFMETTVSVDGKAASAEAPLKLALGRNETSLTKTVVDTVRYVNLQANVKYLLLGVLKDVTDPQQPQVIDQQTKEFSPAKVSDTVDVTFSQVSLQPGHTYVVDEFLYDNEADFEQVKQLTAETLDDKPQPYLQHLGMGENSQTIVVALKLYTEIATKIAGGDNQDSDFVLSTETQQRLIQTTPADAAGKQVAVKDTMSFAGLTPNTNYQLVGLLYDISTGEYFTGKVQQFTPSESAGTAELDFGQQWLEPGHKYVAFEYLYPADTKINLPDFTVPEKPVEVTLPPGQLASHADRKDQAQAVVVGGLLQTSVSVAGQHDDAGTVVTAAQSDEVKDTITYSNFAAADYRVLGLLVDVDDQHKIIATATGQFSSAGPASKPGTLEVSFGSPQLTKGHRYVIYEFAYEQSLPTSLQVNSLPGQSFAAVKQQIREQASSVHMNSTDVQQLFQVAPELATQVKAQEQQNTATATLPVPVAVAESSALVPVTDTVQISGVVAGVNYQLLALLKDLDTGKFVASALHNFAGPASSQSVDFGKVTVNPGHRYVAYEYLYLAGATEPIVKPSIGTIQGANYQVPAGAIARHEQDIAPQMFVTGGKLGTTVKVQDATGATTTGVSNQIVQVAAGDASVSDQVTLTGFNQNYDYQLVGILIDDTAQQPLAVTVATVTGAELKDSATTPVSKDLQFAAPVALRPGHTYVVHEYLYLKGAEPQIELAEQPSLAALTATMQQAVPLASHALSPAAGQSQAFMTAPSIATTLSADGLPHPANQILTVLPTGVGQKVVDTVQLTGILADPATAYDVVGLLMELPAEGTPETVVALAATEVDKAALTNNQDGTLSGQLQLNFGIENRLALTAGKTYVAYEYLVARPADSPQTSSPFVQIPTGWGASPLAENPTSRLWPMLGQKVNIVAAHEDAQDTQQILKLGGKLSTSATSLPDFVNPGVVSGTGARITDQVHATGLEQNTYPLLGVLVNKTTGQVAATQTGQLEVTLDNASTSLQFTLPDVAAGAEYVAFEYAFTPGTTAAQISEVTPSVGTDSAKIAVAEQMLAAKHTDLLAISQTVVGAPKIQTVVHLADQPRPGATDALFLPVGTDKTVTAALSDTVELSGLYPDQRYDVYGALVQLDADGSPTVVASGHTSVPDNPAAGKATVEVPLKVEEQDPQLQANTEYVVYEYLFARGLDGSYQGPDNTLPTSGFLAAHTEQVATQTVQTGPWIGTTVSVADSTAGALPAHVAFDNQPGTTQTVTITDTVKYHGPTTSADFHLLGVLRDATGKVVAVATGVLPAGTADNGTSRVVFTNVPVAAGMTYVAAEYAYQTPVAEPEISNDQVVIPAGYVMVHDDRQDPAQSLQGGIAIQTVVSAAGVPATPTAAVTVPMPVSGQQQVAVVDTVTLSGLQPGVSYDLVGVLRDVTADKFVAAGVTPAVAGTEAQVTMLAGDKTPVLESGHTYVAYEYLYQRTGDLPVATPTAATGYQVPAGFVAHHANDHDQAQMIVAGNKPDMQTEVAVAEHTANLAKDLVAIATQGGKQPVSDRIVYQNLVPNGTYTVTARLMRLGQNGVRHEQPVEVARAVVARTASESGNGEWQIPFGEVDLASGAIYVAFEQVEFGPGSGSPQVGGPLPEATGAVLVHENPEDYPQVVVVQNPDGEIPTIPGEGGGKFPPKEHLPNLTPEEPSTPVVPSTPLTTPIVSTPASTTPVVPTPTVVTPGAAGSSGLPKWWPALLLIPAVVGLLPTLVNFLPQPAPVVAPQLAPRVNPATGAPSSPAVQPAPTPVKRQLLAVTGANVLWLLLIALLLIGGGVVLINRRRK